MKNTPKKALPLRTKRRGLGTSGADWVTVSPLYTGRPFPTLVTPKVEGLDLCDWARANGDFVQRLWEDKRALLFRDFELDGIAGFRAFSELAGAGPRLPYFDRSTPREEYGSNVYCTTIYPPEHPIRLHNEGSYWTVHALKAVFGCITAPTTGGETPIGDVHAVYQRIDPAIREEFSARKWMLVRNYNAGFALSWQEVFQTQDRADVEAYCKKNRIEWEWTGEDRLRTRQIREPILAHPRTGELLWHNHAAFFHITTREPEVRDALRRQFADDELPYNTYYGDGGEIDADVIRHVNEAYDAELVKFRWQEGDIHMIDNARLAHAREPFTGDRLILVALMEAFTPGESIAGAEAAKAAG